MTHSKGHGGLQSSGPWDPWLLAVENTRPLAQRAHSARCAPMVSGWINVLCHFGGPDGSDNPPAAPDFNSATDDIGHGEIDRLFTERVKRMKRNPAQHRLLCACDASLCTHDWGTPWPRIWQLRTSKASVDNYLRDTVWQPSKMVYRIPNALIL